MRRAWLPALATLGFAIACTHPGGQPDTAAGAPGNGRDSASETGRVDSELQSELQAMASSFRGEVGIYVRHLGTGATAELRADETFPTASVIKVPLLIALHERVERGEFRFEDELTFRDSLRYADYDLTARFRDGETIPLGQLAFLMAALSDNTASLWIQALVGGGQAVNRWLEDNGFQATRVNSRTPGRRSDWEVYGWGQTTPREIARLMVMIREGRAVSPAASERMYRTLSRSYWDDAALSSIPATVQAAGKQGFVSRSRSEVLLVNSPTGDYVMAILTRNQEDSSSTPHDEGLELLRAVSATVYRRFTR
jgi:beta-lactamase class A